MKTDLIEAGHTIDSARRRIFVPPVQIVLFCLGSLTLFFPNLQRTFASDDFEVIGLVAWGHRLNVKGSFRPLSDVTLFLNYLISGWHAWSYYLFNIVIHGINSYLVYRFCLKWRWRRAEAVARNGQWEYALFAALFFLAYPFHSEGIDWILGRGASLCTLFGLGALLILVSGLSRGRRYFWAGLMYFLGMAAYEPVILLPIYCLVVLYVRKADRRELIEWMVVLTGVFLLNLAVRVLVSGVVANEYGAAFVGVGPGRLVINMVKVGGRLLLPPSDDIRLQIAVFSGLLLVLAAVIRLFIKRVQPVDRRYPGALLLLLGISCIVPAVTAVSTRTSESDRLLYFPSVFLCCILAFLLVRLVEREVWRWVGAVLIIGYMVSLLEWTNANWVRADVLVRSILRTAGRSEAEGKVFIINVPDERDGAYLFRHGLPEAWRVAGGSDSMLIVINHLTRDQELKLPDPLLPSGDGVLVVPPQIVVRSAGGDSLRLMGPGGAEWRAGRRDRVYYWDREKLVRVLFP